VPPQASCSGRPAGHLAQTVCRRAERAFERVDARPSDANHPASASGSWEWARGSMRTPIDAHRPVDAHHGAVGLNVSSIPRSSADAGVRSNSSVIFCP